MSSASRRDACARSSPALRETYCGTIGVEFMHIQDPEQKAWIQERIEATAQPDRVHRRRASSAILRAPDRGRDLRAVPRHANTPAPSASASTAARALIPALEQIMQARRPARRQGVRASACRIAAASTCSPTSWASPSPRSSPSSRAIPPIPRTSRARATSNTTSAPRPTASSTASVVHLSLTANPSHLEAVNPVVLGKVRAKQHQRERHRARAGHGPADPWRRRLRRPGRWSPRSLDLSELNGYRTGGTIHFIVNNQIGFTTSPVLVALRPLLHRRREERPGADLPRQRRRSGSGGACRAHRHRVPPAVQEGRRHRHVLLPPPRPQRGRRAGLHPAADVPDDRRAPDDARRSTPSGSSRKASIDPGRGRPRWRPSSTPARSASSRRRRATSRTRPIGSKAPGPGLRVASGDDRRGETAVPLELLQRGRRGAHARCPTAFNLNRKIVAPARGQAAGDRDRARASTGRPAEALAFGSLLRRRHAGAPVRPGLRAAAPSASAMRCWSTRRPRTRYIPLNNIRDGPGARSRSSTARCRRPACSASNTATASPTRRRW